MIKNLKGSLKFCQLTSHIIGNGFYFYWQRKDRWSSLDQSLLIKAKHAQEIQVTHLKGILKLICRTVHSWLP